jgi:hypothetical protein
MSPLGYATRRDRGREEQAARRSRTIFVFDVKAEDDKASVSG